VFGGQLDGAVLVVGGEGGDARGPELFHGGQGGVALELDGTEALPGLGHCAGQLGQLLEGAGAPARGGGHRLVIQFAWMVTTCDMPALTARVSAGGSGWCGLCWGT
jgi:hypothetical protein